MDINLELGKDGMDARRVDQLNLMQPFLHTVLQLFKDDIIERCHICFGVKKYKFYWGEGVITGCNRNCCETQKFML